MPDFHTLSILERRHIAETCREMLRHLEQMRGWGYIPEIVLDAHEEELRECLRILGEPDGEE